MTDTTVGLDLTVPVRFQFLDPVDGHTMASFTELVHGLDTLVLLAQLDPSAISEFNVHEYDLQRVAELESSDSEIMHLLVDRLRAKTSGGPLLPVRVRSDGSVRLREVEYRSPPHFVVEFLPTALATIGGVPPAVWWLLRLGRQVVDLRTQAAASTASIAKASAEVAQASAQDARARLRERLYIAVDEQVQESLRPRSDEEGVPPSAQSALDDAINIAVKALEQIDRVDQLPHP